jgi:hypothetical protein
MCLTTARCVTTRLATRERFGSEAFASRVRMVTMLVQIEVEETMLILPEPNEGRFKYLVDRFEQFRILLLFGYVGGPKLQNRAMTMSKKQVSFTGVGCILDASNHTSRCRISRCRMRSTTWLTNLAQLAACTWLCSTRLIGLVGSLVKIEQMRKE